MNRIYRYRKIIGGTVVFLLLLAGSWWGYSNRLKIIRWGSKLGIISQARKAGVIKVDVPGFYQALGTQNLLYDFNEDGKVSGEDYSLLLNFLSKEQEADKPNVLGVGSKSQGGITAEGEASAEHAGLPSDRSFGSDAFTGAATASYPLDLPSYKANLGVSLGLTYSSTGVDDLYTGTETRFRNGALHNYQKQAGIVGLGWNINGMQYITRNWAGTFEDESDDTYVLAFSGGAATLTKESDDGVYSVWRTVPNLKVKIERYARCKWREADGGPVWACRYHWVITDGAGTKYYFGYPATVSDWRRANDPDKDEPMQDGAGDDWYPLYDDSNDGPLGYNSFLISGSQGKGYHAFTTKWLLYQAESVYDQSGPPQNFDCDQPGCEVEINYRYLFAFGSRHDNSYVQAEYPLKITYGPHEVIFGREGRLDRQTHSGDDDSPAQTFQAQERINKITVKTLGKTRKVYFLNYHYGWDPLRHADDGDGIAESEAEVVAGQVIHSLLDKIDVYSDDPATNPNTERLPSFTFSYGDNCFSFTGGCPLTAFIQNSEAAQARTPNDFFLMSADNGNNGKVDFEYYTDDSGNNALNIKYCDPDKLTYDGNVCKTDHAYNTQRHRIKAKIVHDGMGNTVRTEYNYTGEGATQGLAYVKEYAEFEEWYEGQNCCNVRGGQCQDGDPSGCRCPGDNETCESQGGEWDCVGGRDCQWDDHDTSCCPSDLPDEKLMSCENFQGDRYFCTPYLGDNALCASNCKYRYHLETFSDFEFLGYGEVETIVYEKNSSTDIAAKSAGRYHQALDTESCFKPSPLKGMPSVGFTYDANDANRYNQAESSYTVRFGDMFAEYVEKTDDRLDSYCADYDPETTVSLVMPTETLAKSVMPNPQLCTKTTVDYNNLDGSVDHYALPHVSMNLGKVSCSNPDEPLEGTRATITEYTAPNDIKGLHPRVKETRQQTDRYARESYLTARMYYDGQSLGVLGDYGNPTGAEVINPDGSVYSTSQTQYNEDFPWQVYKNIDPQTHVTEFAYDEVLRTYPVKVRDHFDRDTLTEYDFNTADTSHPNYGGVLGVPVKVTDLNDATTTFLYDNWGRQVEIYLPGKNPGAGVKPDQFSRAYYFNENEISPCDDTHHCLTGLGLNNVPKMMVFSGQRYSDSGGAGIVSGSHSYVNGVGQNVQTRSVWYEGEWNNGGAPVEGEGLKDIISSQTYTALGQPEWQSLSYTADPYQDTGNSSSFDARNFITDPGIKKTNFTYDGFGRPVFTNYPDGTKTKIEYEIGGNPLVTRTSDKNCLDDNPDTLCAEEKITVDSYGQTIRTEQAAPDQTIATSFEYHPVLGAVTKTIDTLGNIVNQIEYDWLGRKVKMWDIDMSPAMSGEENSWRYEYDTENNLVKQTNPKGVVTQMTYDQLNRFIYKKVDTKNILHNTYDNCDYGKNRLCQSVSYELPSGNEVLEVNLDYDLRGRLAREERVFKNLPDGEVNNQNLVTTYSYDEGGRAMSENQQGNSDLGIPAELIAFVYNRRFLSAVAGDSNYASNAVYNKDGRMLSFNSGNGVINAYAYDRNNLRLTGLGVDEPSWEPGAGINLSYRYEPAGNITGINNNNANPFFLTQEFTYDAFSRLTGAGNAYNASFTYDNLGNILTKSEGPRSVALAYGNYASGFYHRPQTVTIDGIPLSYQYDEIGNLTSEGDVWNQYTAGDVWNQYTYDDDNRLIKTENSGNVLATYIYDGGGRRIAKISPYSQKNTYYLSPSLEYVIFNDGRSYWRKNYYFGGKLVAVRRSDLEGGIPTPTFTPTPTVPAGTPTPTPIQRITLSPGCFPECPPGTKCFNASVCIPDTGAGKQTPEPDTPGLLSPAVVIKAKPVVSGDKISAITLVISPQNEAGSLSAVSFTATVSSAASGGVVAGAAEVTIDNSFKMAGWQFIHNKVTAEDGKAIIEIAAAPVGKKFTLEKEQVIGTIAIAPISGPAVLSLQLDPQSTKVLAGDAVTALPVISGN